MQVKRFAFQLIIESNATASVRSPVRNLADCHPDITVERVRDAIAEKYLESEKCIKVFERFKLVNPTEQDFPGKLFLYYSGASLIWQGSSRISISLKIH